MQVTLTIDITGPELRKALAEWLRHAAPSIVVKCLRDAVQDRFASLTDPDERALFTRTSHLLTHAFYEVKKAEQSFEDTVQP